MKTYRKLLVPFALLLAVASSGVAAWDGCWFCEQQFRQCVRSGTSIDACWEQREICYAMNGCMPLEP